ncbi:C4-dicarboxylate ABC transporter substrate-binding protein, partial [Paraburkholderia sp. BR14261]
MLKTMLAGLAALITLLFSTLALAAAADANYKIVTGQERGTYIQIGQDLAKWVAQPAGIDLEV